MIYMGSKRDLAQAIIKIIRDNLPKGGTYIELFCGGCAVAEEIPNNLDYNIVINDINTPLMEFYKKGISGYVPQTYPADRETVYQWRNQDKDQALKGESIYLYSFRGTRWGYQNQQYKNKLTSYLSTVQKIKHYTLLNKDYRDIDITQYDPETTFIYNDIPYKNSRIDGYVREALFFSHDAYWEWVRKHSELGYKIVTSEYTAPEDFQSIKDFKFTAKIGAKVTDTQTYRYNETLERLFVYSPYKNLYKVSSQKKFI